MMSVRWHAYGGSATNCYNVSGYAAGEALASAPLELPCRRQRNPLTRHRVVKAWTPSACGLWLGSSDARGASDRFDRRAMARTRVAEALVGRELRTRRRDVQDPVYELSGRVYV